MRNRVKGNNGPRRYDLPNVELLDNSVPMGVTDEILRLAEETDRNDLGTNRYQISQTCPLVEIFGPQYRQILLQGLREGHEETDEHAYTEWVDEAKSGPIREYLESKFSKVYRTRISVMPPNHELDWHIDTDTSVLCRIQIAAIPGDSRFEFDRRGTIERLYMRPGESWFINVGWPHRVVSKSTRVVLIAGVDYENLEHKVHLV